MKNFIEVPEDAGTVLINVQQICKIDWDNDGTVIYLNGGYEVHTNLNVMEVQHLIEKSYLS